MSKKVNAKREAYQKKQEQQGRTPYNQQPMLPVPGTQHAIDDDQDEGNPRPFVGVHSPEEIVARGTVEVDGCQQVAVGLADCAENAFRFHVFSNFSAKLIIFLCFVADVRFNLYLC